MNQTQITELFSIIADGGLEANDIAAMCAEVVKAEADPQTYLANDPKSNYKADFTIPLWQWVLLEQLEDGLIFRAAKADELYKQVEDAFGEGELVLTSAELKDIQATEALALIQKELDPTYTLVNFSQPLNGEMQLILLRSNKLGRFTELCRTLDIAVSPACVK